MKKIMCKSGVLSFLFAIVGIVFGTSAAAYGMEYYKISRVTWTQCHTTVCWAEPRICTDFNDWGTYPVQGLCNFGFMLGTDARWQTVPLTCASTIAEGTQEAYSLYPRNQTFLCGWSDSTEYHLWLRRGQEFPDPLPVAQVIVFPILSLLFFLLAAIWACWSSTETKYV